MMYAEHFNKAMETRVREVAAELRRRGFHGQALYDELDRRARGHRAHLANAIAEQKDRPAAAVKAAEAALDRAWSHWQAGGRAALLAECDAAGV